MCIYHTQKPEWKHYNDEAYSSLRLPTLSLQYGTRGSRGALNQAPRISVAVFIVWINASGHT